MFVDGAGAEQQTLAAAYNARIAPVVLGGRRNTLQRFPAPIFYPPVQSPQLVPNAAVSTGAIPSALVTTAPGVLDMSGEPGPNAPSLIVTVTPAPAPAPAGGP